MKVFPSSAEGDSIAVYDYNTFSSLFWDDQMVVLKCTYDQTQFDEEVNRLSADEFFQGKRLFYTDTVFKTPAYIAVYNTRNCYEYALLDSQACTITYVYLQYPSSFIEMGSIDTSLLPLKWTSSRSCYGETFSFSVYDG